MRNRRLAEYFSSRSKISELCSEGVLPALPKKQKILGEMSDGKKFLLAYSRNCGSENNFGEGRLYVLTIRPEWRVTAGFLKSDCSGEVYK